MTVLFFWVVKRSSARYLMVSPAAICFRDQKNRILKQQALGTTRIWICLKMGGIFPMKSPFFIRIMISKTIGLVGVFSLFSDKPIWKTRRYLSLIPLRSFWAGKSSKSYMWSFPNCKIHGLFLPSTVDFPWPLFTKKCSDFESRCELIQLWNPWVKNGEMF